jgi:hypothetical protein
MFHEVSAEYPLGVAYASPEFLRRKLRNTFDKTLSVADFGELEADQAVIGAMQMTEVSERTRRICELEMLNAKKNKWKCRS